MKKTFQEIATNSFEKYFV